MDGRCETCRWWEPSPSEPESVYGHYFKRPEFGVCALGELEDGDKLAHPETLAFAEDAESYKACLMTSPKFGCVQYERKDG